jgi:hypothetical protein
MYQKRNDIIIIDHIPKLIENRVVDKEDKALKSINVWLAFSYKRRKRKGFIEKIFK